VKTIRNALPAVAGIRQNPLQIVGFRGFTTHVFDSERVHYPGRIGNCLACHTETGFTLPLRDTVLATSIDTGENRRDPGDDRVVSPTAAVCAGCHDDQVARAHMITNGASFATSKAALDSGEVVEQCALCHGPGQIAGVAQVHPVRELP